MNPYDQAARYAARLLDPLGFLRWLLAEVFLAWEWRGWLDTQTVPFPGEPERRCDTVARFLRRDRNAPPVAAVLEFQARPQGDMLERLADYTLQVRHGLPYQQQPRVLYDVVGVVVNLTGPAQADTW